MTDEEAVLQANRAFYAAFAAGDFPTMDALWSTEAEVACVHPGWSPLLGRGEVMASWETLLRAPPPIRLGPATAFVHDGAAFVLCLELIDRTVLSATNIFVREAGGWRMVHHQAGPNHDAAPPDEPPAAGSVH
jgi:ketosteroid isomerase-like protein